MEMLGLALILGLLGCLCLLIALDPATRRYSDEGWQPLNLGSRALPNAFGDEMPS